jgi:hypothetical protein
MSIIALSAKINIISNSQPIKTESEPLSDIQISASPLSKEHQIVPVSILVYTEYVDIDQEFVNTMQAIDNTYGTDYYYENLTDYTELGTKLQGYDIFLIPEQELAPNEPTHMMMKTIGTAWASTLTNFVNDGGIVVLLDFATVNYYGPGLHIYNESGLMKINGVSDYYPIGSLATLNLVNTSDALARGVASSWSAQSGTISVDTNEATVVVDDGTNPIVVHKIMGRGHIVYLGFDLYSSDSNYENLLGNVIRLHRHVIFDASHGQTETIFNYFSDYADDLVSEGFAISSMSSFNPAYINTGDVLIITRASTTYTEGQVDVIENFVKNGGGLFVATDSELYGNEIDPIINRFGFIREDTYSLEDSDDLLNGYPILIEYDNIINHSLTLGVSTIEFYYHTGFTTIPSSADIIIATDTDGTSDWSDTSPADGIPVVATIVTAGNGRVAAFSDQSFMWDGPMDQDSDGTINYEDADNEVLLMNAIRWLSAAGVEECIVLFDESKTPYRNIEKIYYRTFGNYLTSNGYTLKWMSTFQTSLIETADIIFIADGTSSYTTNEIGKITNFVYAGGGLFLLGDLSSYSAQIDPIANVFGIDINETAGYICDLDEGWGLYPPSIIPYESANFGTHPVTQGISRIEINRGTGLASIGGGTALISTDTDGTSIWDSGAPANGIPIMAATQYHYGRVIVLTDLNFVETFYDDDGDGDTDFFDSDNERLTVNSFQWLSEAGRPSVGEGDDDDDGGGGGVSEFPWLLLMIIIGAIVGIIALAAIVLFLKKKR